MLKAAARTLSLQEIARFSEDEAMARMAKLRWPDTDGAPVCPECGCVECYAITSRRRYKCAACWKQFSITSGTIFHSRKLSYRDLLLAIFLFINGAKGVSALHLSRDLDINPKSAFILLHKLRESILDSRRDVILDGVVETDVAHYGDAPRSGNSGREGKQKASKPADPSRKQCVMALVQRNGSAVAVVVPAESQETALAVATKHIRPGSTVAADEHGAYDILHAKFSMLRINHRWAYWDGDATTNSVESFHSRMRRAELGIYHRISGRYLGSYASEMAYRHSRRKTDNGAIFDEIVEIALAHPESRNWKGAWQKRGASTGPARLDRG